MNIKLITLKETPKPITIRELIGGAAGIYSISSSSTEFVVVDKGGHRIYINTRSGAIEPLTDTAWSPSTFLKLDEGTELTITA